MRPLVLFLIAAAGCASAGEYAVLSGGSRIHADRHETLGGKVRLYTGSGFIELDASKIHGFEADGEVPTTPVRADTEPAGQPSSVQLADAAADRYGLPRQLVRSVISAESGFRAKAISPKGAIGLMQLMPGTAETLGVNPNDPAQNVDAGTRYLRQLLIKYHGLLWHALAAYNAGPGAVEKYNGIPPYRETVNYVKRIDRNLKQPGDYASTAASA
jgi:soluble lytic murein transglycosylase-like protein